MLVVTYALYTAYGLGLPIVDDFLLIILKIPFCWCAVLSTVVLEFLIEMMNKFHQFIRPNARSTIEPN